MKPLLLIISLLTFISCRTKSEPSKQDKRQIQDTKLNFHQAVQRHFEYIDSVRKIDPDLIELENVKLQQTLIAFKQEVFNTSDTLDFNWPHIVKSTDKQLSLVSWDTRMGGTMIDYATMALFKNNNGEVRTKMLIDTTNSGMENTLMHYDTIHIVENNVQKFYLAHGFGQGSTALPWQEIRAFAIENNKLLNPNIFSDNKPNLFAEFDTHEFHGGKRVPTIKIREGGKTIQFPIATEQGGFSGKYQTLVLEGQVYKAK
jgi:hypothetical protein